LIADKINGLKDPDFKAEESVLKSGWEATEGGAPSSPPLAKEGDRNSLPTARYGELGTVRFDAYENRRKISTVCVYDPKIGKAGLRLPRMTELAKAAYKLFGYVPRHIFVIEVRPGQRQP
jgi:hypothetical protein